MTNEYLFKRGYRQYDKTPFDNEHIVARFQKRFDDDIGKKYFIDIVKWSNEYIPESHRGKWYEPFSYEYEMQVHINDKPINLELFAGWSLDDVEKFAEDFFEKMCPNYYERWDEE